jgi:hypothetical protein
LIIVAKPDDERSSIAIEVVARSGIPGVEVIGRALRGVVAAKVEASIGVAKTHARERINNKSQPLPTV